MKEQQGEEEKQDRVKVPLGAGIGGEETSLTRT